MKKMYFAVIAAVLLVSPAGPIFAATFEGAESYSLGATETINHDLYVGSANARISGTIKGDLFVGGGAITISGDISEDVAAGGGSITLLGNVGGDARLGGGQINIGSAIEEDLIVGGGSVFILSDAVIGKDVFVGGGAIVIDGNIKGKTDVRGDEIELNGIFEDDVVIEVGSKLTLGKQTNIKGSLTYTASEELTMSENAVVEGEIIFNQREGVTPTKDIDKGVIAVILGVLSFVKLVITLTAGLALVLLFPKFIKAVAERAINSYGKEFVRGFIVLIVVPVGVILSFITVIGVLLGVIGILTYAIFILIAKILAGIVAGSLVYKLFYREHEITANWKTTVIGIILLHLIYLIPFIGWIICLALFLMALGAISQFCYQKHLHAN
ncbi:hypothetical protein ACFL3E_01470 [Patescibacteria group bacterium]